MHWGRTIRNRALGAYRIKLSRMRQWTVTNLRPIGVYGLKVIATQTIGITFKSMGRKVDISKTWQYIHGKGSED